MKKKDTDSCRWRKPKGKNALCVVWRDAPTKRDKRLAPLTKTQGNKATALCTDAPTKRYEMNKFNAPTKRTETGCWRRRWGNRPVSC